MNFYLMGMMGSGKSTVGKILAKMMEMPFVDLDHEIEKSAGKPINNIFEIDGEDTFRKLESDRLRKISNSVISCGGGIILRKDNCIFIQENGKAILLTASIKELAMRLTGDSERPLLNHKNKHLQLRKIWDERKKLYFEIAHYVINTENQSPEKITNDLFSKLKL